MLYSLWCPEMGEAEKHPFVVDANNIYQAVGVWLATEQRKKTIARSKKALYGMGSILVRIKKDGEDKTRQLFINHKI